MPGYPSVLNARVKRDDLWFEGRVPPPSQMVYTHHAPGDDDTKMDSYDANCFCNLTTKDVHVERPATFQHRNGKDHRLTTKAIVQTVNPQDPRREDYILPQTYDRVSNKLQVYYSGVANRVENITGKRKAVSTPVQPSNVYTQSINTAYNEPTPVPSVNSNVSAARDTMPDVLTNYPQIVEFTLDTMKSTPAGVPNVPQPATVDLVRSANAGYARSVNRFLPS